MADSAVVGADPVRGSDARVSSPVLVGRDDEIAALLQAVTASPALVVVEGEGGVGKTRLVQELLGRPELRGHRVLVGGAYPLREPFPLTPLVEALRGGVHHLAHRSFNPVAGALRPLLPEAAEHLPPPLDPLSDARAERHRVMRGLVEVLDQLGRSLVVLEDLHWADQATLEFLQYLGANLPERLAVIGTFRPEEAAAPSVLRALSTHALGAAGMRVVVRPLDREGVRGMVQAILDTSTVSDEFAAFLYERTAGLPFAVEEVVRLLQERRDIVRKHGRWTRRHVRSLEVPAAVRDSVLELVERLEPRVRQVVEAAAVLRLPSDDELLRTVARAGEELSAGLTQALRARVLVEGEDGISLRHTLAADAVEAALPGPRRRELHRRAACALSERDQPPLARLVHHLRESGDTRAWVQHAEAAADVAVLQGDDEAACRFLHDVLTQGDPPPAVRARLADKLGRAALEGLAHHEAIEVLRNVLSGDGLAAPERAPLHLQLAALLSQAGNASEAWTEFGHAVEPAGDRTGLFVEAACGLAWPFVEQGRLPDHLHWAERAVAAAASCDPLTRRQVATDQATLLVAAGDPRGWDAAGELDGMDPGVEGARRESVRACLNLAHAALAVGHYRRVDELLVEGGRFAAALDGSRFDDFLRTAHLMLHLMTGRWEGLGEQASSALEREPDVPHAVVEAELVLGWLALAHGDPNAAEPRLTRVLDTARQAGGLVVAGAAAAALSRLQLARDSTDAAAGVAGQIVEGVRHKGIWVWAADAAPYAVEALVAAGRRAEAEALLEAYARGVRGRDAPLARAALAWCRGVLDEDPARASRHLRQAVGAYDALPRPYEAAQVREHLAAVALEAGRAGGVRHAEEALEAFRSLGATWDAARVRRLLRGHGIRATYRGGRRGYGQRLSPREEEVARLAAAGRTNREIAETLFVSQKTVEKHLTAALRKLQVDSRRDLEAALG